jgi:hypothetical protein
MNAVKVIKISSQNIAAVTASMMTGMFSVCAVNIDQVQAQSMIGNQRSAALSPAHQMLLDAQQSNAPSIGAGSMQLLRFSQNSLSFAPLEGINKFLKWQITDDADAISSQPTFADCIDKFKQEQRDRLGAVSKMQEAINRL